VNAMISKRRLLKLQQGEHSGYKVEIALKHLIQLPQIQFATA
jgi:hypothetical protein